ncbi:hypothetical protein [Nostoc sp. ChiSLP03a]|uniref:hypothetical protein n=1 Tax=Nostoc sp. ChiSLP03a TaxID=3075380 RepID=UPI002AD2E93D|nr:hypothetical protein [Nostoc sp. ChiSLP03a]MDZ8211627.1 hypothetical protein [Nostoc sp. ChiSLP03a]
MTISFSGDDPEWNEWWVDPIEEGSPQADPTDLRETQQYIQRTYTEETQEKIIIKVRPQKED